MPRKIKHGYGVRVNRPKIYGVWSSMIQRCTNPKDKKWKHYGGRGILVCEKWTRFEGFLADVGEAPPGLTFGRIDGKKGYEPGNCEWQSYKTQNRNTSRNRILTVRGITGCVSELLEHFGADEDLVRGRLKWGWSSEDAFFAPKKKIFRRRSPQR